jgi:hypothetical protein
MIIRIFGRAGGVGAAAFAGAGSMVPASSRLAKAASIVGIRRISMIFLLAIGCVVIVWLSPS